MAVAKLSSAYWTSCILHVANRLDLFTRLAKRRATAGELANEIGADPRGLEILMVACAALGLLDRRRGRYRDTPLSRTFLAKGSPRYQGGIVSMFEEWYPAWGRLAESVISGKPAVQKPHDQGDEATRTYIMGMHYRAVGQAMLLAKDLDLSGRHSMIDIAGGPGTFSIHLCRKNRGLRAEVLDLPQTLRITKEIIANHGMADRVTTREGNYLTDTRFGADFDVAFLSSMFNQESPEVIRRILDKAREALAPGGIVIVQDQMLNDQKTGPLLSALIGVNQLLHTPGGAAYSRREIADLMRAAGLRKVRPFPLSEESPFVVLIGER